MAHIHYLISWHVFFVFAMVNAGAYIQDERVDLQYATEKHDELSDLISLKESMGGK